MACAGCGATNRIFDYRYCRLWILIFWRRKCCTQYAGVPHSTPAAERIGNSFLAKELTVFAADFAGCSRRVTAPARIESCAAREFAAAAALKRARCCVSLPVFRPVCAFDKLLLSRF